MYESVVNFASRVLDNDRDNVKAFYRRGVAYKHIKRYR
jgi:tetratricopeptide (TPR) repeat protein